MKDLKEQFRELCYGIQYINKYWSCADLNNATSIVLLTHNGSVLNKEIRLTEDNRNDTAIELLKGI